MPLVSLLLVPGMTEQVTGQCISPANINGLRGCSEPAPQAWSF